ncbi:MAG: hypothetical protein WC615_02560 [Mucilaginibacter sp.]|jgi:hypothetical protein|uniref:hypothetical protein n=1 Tax=Mucilaginibacter sp. TaxID=1882438 RepID=UPI003564F672
MTTLLPQYYELLKTAVLTETGLSTITPCDCKIISASIFNKTKQSISETTLKRVYGFAYSKFKPSLFTIDVMAKYCGYPSWEDFCLEQDQNTVKTQDTSAGWEILKLNAGKITSFTLQVLRNKSGIPYSQTIKRQFLDEHFNEFLNGDYTATILAAPAGYGKTIALCHWIEERLILNTEGKTNDIILFFSTSALMNAFLSGRDLNHWLLALLGYSADNDIATLFDKEQKKGGNFFLVIDDLDEYVYKPEQFKLLLNQLLDIFSLYQFVPWFKLILTMRSSTWINNKHDIDNGNSSWLKGFIGNEQWATNIPLFSPQEIKELCLNINPAAKDFAAVDLADDFNHPLYFQFYYKEHKDNFTLTDINHVSIHELISTFILNKIYLGHHSAEKVLLLKGLIEQMDFAQQIYNVPKTKVNALIKQYHNAYNELISIGFIRELNTSSDLHYRTCIQFSNDSFLEYTIAKTLLNANNFIFDTALIKGINTQFANNPHKLSVLKWCIIYAIKTGQQKSFDLLAQTQLTFTEKSNLIIFLGDLFEKEFSAANKSESLVLYFKQDCSKELFNYFFGLEFINIRHEKTLHCLSKFGLASRKRILIYTALAVSAVMRMNLDDLHKNLIKLQSFPPEDYNKFSINPLHCIDAMYSYFKNGVIKKGIFVELTRFYFNPPYEGNYFENNASNDMLYLLGAYTLLLTNNPVKTLRYINVLKKHYKETDFTTNYGYSFFLNMATADCYFRLGKTRQLVEIYSIYSTSYKQDASAFTDYMKNLFYALRIKTNISLNKYTHIIEDIKSHAQIAHGQKLSQIFVLLIILNTPQIADLYPQFYKQCHYEHTKLLRECGLTANLYFKTIPLYNT